MNSLLRRLASPVSHSRTSYLSSMTWFATWTLRSFAVPLTSESGGKEEQVRRFSVIKKTRQRAIYVGTAVIWVFYNVMFSFWFYKNIYNPKEAESPPIWDKVIAFFFLMKYILVFGIHVCLLLRKRELLHVMRASFWMEPKCVSKGNCFCNRLLSTVSITGGVGDHSSQNIGPWFID